MDIVRIVFGFLGGLGLFLYGMHLFEESMKDVSDSSFIQFLQRWTLTPLRGIFTGFFSTIVLQSSTVVTVLVLGLVGAHVFSLQQALGVVLGTNLGTATSTWLVSLLGFSLDISLLALPFIAIGAFILTLGDRSKTYYSFAVLLFGVGSLLLGLEYMKDSFSFIQESFSLSHFLGMPSIVYILLAIGLTILVQSSTAMSFITLAALHSGVISFDIGMLMMIGANIGTTFTAVLGSLSGSRVKWQVAIFHVFFNVLTGIVVWIGIDGFGWIIKSFIGVKNDVYALGLFHILFNSLGVLLFFPFINPIMTFIETYIPDKESFVKRFFSRLPFFRKPELP